MSSSPSSTSSSDEREKLRKLEKKQKKEKKRQRELEEAQAAATAEADVAAIEADANASIEADNEINARKRHKTEKKEKERKKHKHETVKSEEPTSAAMECEPCIVAAVEETREQRKARKAAKRAADEAEVLAAGARALEEEAAEETPEERAERKQKKREKKERERAAAAAASSSSSSAPVAAAAASSSSSSSTTAPASTSEPKRWPTPPPGNTSLLLFYQYVRPSWSPAQRQQAENFTRDSLTRHGCTGRLRCAREGFNGTLTGSYDGIRAFCQDLREYEPQHFANTDFKLVDGLRDNQMLKGLKVWHVDELVTYGFGATKGLAPIESGGTHLPPREWHDKAAEDNTVLIDVRNANENAIGRFQPLNDAKRVLDPLMRVSTEFPEWVDQNMHKLKAAKQVMMYCTGGIRCERASALLVQKGLDASKVYQLEGGIHRYLEEFKDGGHWIGKNYTFDRRFAHGAVDKTPEVVGRCACCSTPWDRYQAGKKCALCRMEVLICKECDAGKKWKNMTLKCFLCGGPKPTYVPEGESTIKPKKKKNYGDKSEKAESDY